MESRDKLAVDKLEQEGYNKDTPPQGGGSVIVFYEFPQRRE